jgi:hypothetical protein
VPGEGLVQPLLLDPLTAGKFRRATRFTTGESLNRVTTFEG